MQIHDHRLRAADGLELFVREYLPDAAAAGPPVLCVPGLTRNHRDFEALATDLARTHRVLTPDLRGRGQSGWDPNPANYQPLVYVGDLVTLLTTLAVPRVFWIGTSLGGLVGMMTAAMRPGLLAGAVLNDIGPEIDPAGAARIASYVGQLPPVRSWADAVAQVRQVNGPALPDFTDADWLRFARCAYREGADGVPVPDMDPRIGDAVRASSAPLPDLWPLFRALAPVPTLVIRGVLSDILSAATLERMQREKPDLQTLVLPGRGHAPTLDEPECRTAIRSLLVRVSAA